MNKMDRQDLVHYEGGPLLVKKIEASDIRPEIPEIGGSLIILQRNAQDNRQPESSDFGALEASSAELVMSNANEFFDKIFATLPEEERKNIDIIVLASDATLVTPDGQHSEHQRAVETADQVIAGLRKAMNKYSIAPKQLLNSTITTNG
jgi:anthranilate phosphoribosyltransferase